MPSERGRKTCQMTEVFVAAAGKLLPIAIFVVICDKHQVDVVVIAKKGQRIANDIDFGALHTLPQIASGVPHLFYCSHSCSNCFLLCQFFSHTVEHSPVGRTSTFISGQALRFTVSECWLTTASCNYMVARWTAIRENYRNGKLFFRSFVRS